MRGGDSSTTTSVQQLAAAAAAGGGGGGGVGGAHHEAAVSEVGGNNNNSGGEMMDIELGGERSFGGNRWPRQETLALLRIRSEMDVAFRDASVKAPLWDEVSRKLGELGFNRSAKKCKEKFENVYKYHKRTKESRTGKQEGKTYRFFDELQAFDQINNNNHPPPPPPSLSLPPPPPPPAQQLPPQPQSTPPVITTLAPPMTVINQPPSTPVTSTTTAPAPAPQPIANLTIPSFPQPITNAPIRASFASLSPDLMSNSTSSSTSSDVEMQAGRHKRKRKWKDFFERLMRQVIERQEQMQRKFLEAIEKREQERLAKEESWRIQEMARINREREILAQERSISSAKDSAVMAFLQKLSEQPNPQQQQQQPQPQPQPQQVLVTATAAPPQPQPQPLPVVTPPPPPPPPKLQPPPLQLPPQQALVLSTPNLDRSISDINNEDRNLISPGGPSPSRWPKVEVLALIRLRTNLDSKYQENGPKGPLWEEISAGMKRLGYNRNSKRCKEKWENINKYFKKVKESNKKRPEDSKTCPYFHELEALYKEKNSKLFDHNNVGSSSSSASQLLRAVDSSVPLMVQPEQQWPPAGGAVPVQLQSRGGESVMEDLESDEGNHGEEEEEEEEEDEASHGYEIVANNKSTSVST